MIYVYVGLMIISFCFMYGIGVAVSISEEPTKAEKYIFHGSCIIVLSSLALFITNGIISSDVKKFGHLEQDDFANIVSIGDTTKLQGRGNLYHSVVNEKDVYKFYYSTSNGGYKLLTVPTENTYIIEDDSKTPHYERYKYVSDKGKMFNFLFVTDGLNNERTRYIYVPKGTIIQEFTLDL